MIVSLNASSVYVYISSSSGEIWLWSLVKIGGLEVGNKKGTSNINKYTHS
jgi:hypothetical protein